MGSQVIAVCSCGLKEKILIGGGMMNFTNICYFPCYCEKCKSVVEVNLLDANKQCPNCKNPNILPYDNPELFEVPGENIIAEWNIAEELGRVLILTDGNYKCPSCCKMTLHFINTLLLWD